MDGSAAGNSPASSALAPGVRIDRYELVALVRDDTWLARETTSGGDRDVTLRFAPPSLAGDARFRELLRQEAKLAAGVAHPNVAQVLDHGEHEALLFVASEWVEGGTLADLRAALERKKETIPAPILLRILADACAGLHAAHLLRDRTGSLLNVVHGDVSPRSLLLGPGGVTRVADLGLAKAKGRHAGGANLSWLDAGDEALRPPGGQRIDRHADVWGIGAILAQGTGAAEGAPAGDGTAKIVAELVLRARSSDPVERFATAAEMQGAIEAAMVTLGISTSRASVAAFVKEHAAGVDHAGRSPDVPSGVPKPAIASTPTPAVESVPATAHSLRPDLERIVVSTPAIVATTGAISRSLVPAAPPPRPAPSRRGGTALFLAGFAVAVVGSGAIGYAAMRARDRASPVAAAAAPAPPSKPACPKGMAPVTGGVLPPYCIDLVAVTTEAYKACSDAGDCKRAATENRWAGITPRDQKTYDLLCNERDARGRGPLPMNCIDRDMAAVYCQARGARLPTASEWEFVAREPATYGVEAPTGGASEWSSDRLPEVPTTRSYRIGFRCARAL